jgi:hypothetical protein
MEEPDQHDRKGYSTSCGIRRLAGARLDCRDEAGGAQPGQ